MWKNRHKRFFVAVLNGHIQKNSSIVSKPRKKMSSCSREKTDCALPHILNIFSLACARLLDSTIVAKIKQAKRK